MKRLFLILILILVMPACSSTFGHKAVTVEGNKTIGAGVTLNKTGLTLSGVTTYASTTAPIERERRLIAEAKAREAEAKAREAEAKLALTQLRVATPLSVE